MFKRNRIGFTVVELLVVITVVAILAGITIVAYGQWQKKAALTTVDSDLISAASAMEQAINFSDRYPESLDALAKSFQPSPDVSLSLSLASSTGYPVYTNLSNVQQGVLFHSICGDLVSEGYGQGTNNANQSEQYIGGCNVYNHDELQVNSAWSGHLLKTPVSDQALPNIIASINYNESWRPNRDQVEKDFYQEWHDRFQVMGGVYPVDSFWDSWCTGACSWGVQKETLPAPSGGGSPTPEQKYCIQASSQRHLQVVRHITARSAKPVDGPC